VHHLGEHRLCGTLSASNPKISKQKSHVPNPESWFRYPVSRIAFAVLTTKQSYRSRAQAVKRTWFKHVTRGGFYGDEEDDELPIFPYSLFMDEHVDKMSRALLADMVARADYMSSLPKFFLTLHDMYIRNKASVPSTLNPQP